MGHPGSILCTPDIHTDLIALFDEVKAAELSFERVRRRQLHLPAGDGAVVILRVQPKAGVRIRPIDPGDHPPDGNLPGFHRATSLALMG
jgi:hypothetical protein